MGKPFSELPGGDEKTLVSFSQRETEQLITTWKARIEDLIESMKLRGIRVDFLYDLLAQLDAGRRLTTAQTEAVVRMEQAQDRPQRGKGGRRYEGWTGGW